MQSSSRVAAWRRLWISRGAKRRRGAFTPCKAISCPLARRRQFWQFCRARRKRKAQKVFNLGGARPGRATLSFQLRRSAPPRHQFFWATVQARLRSISRNAGTALPEPTRLIAHPAWAEVGHFINSAPPEKMRKSPALLRILSAGIGCTLRPGRMHILTRNPGPESAKSWAGCASCPGI